MIRVIVPQKVALNVLAQLRRHCAQPSVQARWGISRFPALLLLLGLLSAPAQAENWPRFRGDNGTGISAARGIPTNWSPGDYAWNVELPGVGHAAPVIWGDHVFVTTAVDQGSLRYLICLDAKTGDERWKRLLGMNRSRKHAKSSWASSTPATDGNLVYVAFADKENYTVTAYDFDGEICWRRNLGSYESQHGLGVSPILFDGMLIIPNDQRGPSSIVALDALTGTTRWSTLRTFREAAYSSPMLIDAQSDHPQLICVCGISGVSSFDPYTGRLNWQSGAFPLRTVASPVYGDGLVIASCGQGGRYGVLQVAIDTSLDLEAGANRVRWERKRLIPYVPTPIVLDGHLYDWTDEGIVSCVELATGKDVWTKRIGGNFSGSPICCDGKLYCIDESGTVVVLAASTTFQEFARVPLNDPSHSTPAVANGRLYLRTFHRLACLAAKQGS